MSFEQECERKEKLLQLFETLEREERLRLRNLRNREVLQPIAKKFYDRIYKGLVTVTKIKKGSLYLQSESGQKFSPVLINHQVAGLIRKGDVLGLTIGCQANIWRIVFVEMIQSSLPLEEHLSYENQQLTMYIQ